MLRVHVSPFCWVDYEGLSVSPPYQLVLPPMGDVTIRVDDRVGSAVHPQVFRPRAYCALADETAANKIPFKVPSHEGVVATFGMDSFPHPVPTEGLTAALPAGPLYRVKCVADGSVISPGDHLVRVPAIVSFEVVEVFPACGVEVVDRGSVADLSGTVFALERRDGTESVTESKLSNGVAVLPEARLVRMRNAGEDSLLTVLLDDGRLLEGSVAKLSWDAKRKRLMLELGNAREPIRVETGRDEDPGYVRGRRSRGTWFAVNDGASLADPMEFCYSRSGSVLRFHRMPDAWDEVEVVYRDGGVTSVEHLSGQQVRTKVRVSERVLRVDFETSVKPLVVAHGSAVVRFEHRMLQDPLAVMGVADTIAFRAPGDCDGRVWQKHVVKGAIGAIVAEVAGRRIVLAED
ncbi:MAG TPA: hypothetical protein ENI87_04595 [bacterium]|nr:hypothetical protein [bacterium]